MISEMIKTKKPEIKEYTIEEFEKLKNRPKLYNKKLTSIQGIQDAVKKNTNVDKPIHYLAKEYGKSVVSRDIKSTIAKRITCGYASKGYAAVVKNSTIGDITISLYLKNIACIDRIPNTENMYKHIELKLVDAAGTEYNEQMEEIILLGDSRIYSARMGRAGRNIHYKIINASILQSGSIRLRDKQSDAFIIENTKFNRAVNMNSKLKFLGYSRVNIVNDKITYIYSGKDKNIIIPKSVEEINRFSGFGHKNGPEHVKIEADITNKPHLTFTCCSN